MIAGIAASKIRLATQNFPAIGSNLVIEGCTYQPVFQGQSFLGSSYLITGAILHRSNNSGKRRLSIHAGIPLRSFPRYGKRS
jgi:hypothetical protein